jgi:hypothetical protein
MSTLDTTLDPTLTDPDATVTAPLTVSTDQSDYAPLSTAYITTTNLAAGGTVEFVVTDVAGTAVSGTNEPWSVTDGGAGDLDGVANGVVQTSWAVGADAAGEAFVLSATDASGAAATAAFTDTSEPTTFAYTATHIELAASSGVVTPLTAGAIWANAESALNTSLTSSGTGQFGTFVEVQHNGAEQGFNTNANDSLDTKNSNNFNHPLSLSELQPVDASGTHVPLGPGTYYAFKLDLHQSGSTPYISLDDLQIWQSASLSLTDFSAGSSTPGAQPSFVFNSGATLVYDLNSATNEQSSHPNSVLLNSHFTSGSGGGADLVVLIPTDSFNAANGDNVYLYSAFGGGWQANSTFEEWGALLTTGGGTTGSTPSASVDIR